MISWLFEIGTLKLSTKSVTYGANPYAGVILPDSFSGVTMRWDISGSKVIQPNDVGFSISNTSGAYSAGSIEGQYCTIRLIIDGSQSRAWKFKIVSAVEYYKAIVCQCEDFLQSVLDGDYPKTKSPREVWPSTSGDGGDDYCIPVTLGTAYIPIRPINTGSGVYYVLGNSGTYTITEVQSPRDWPSNSTWLESEYTMTQATNAGYSLLQPLINDGAAGVWASSGRLLDMLCKYSNTSTATMTNPADWIEFFLDDIGIDSSDIDSTTFSAAETIYDSESLTFNGGFYEKESRESILSNLLALCDSYLTCSDKIELRQFNATSQETFTNVMLESFSIGAVARHAHNTGRVHWPESGQPQDVLAGKTTISIDDSITDESVSSEILEAWPMAGQSQNAQKAARLYFQKRFGQKNTISFKSTFTSLTNTGLVPGMVITVNNSLYGGNYAAILTEMTINKDMSMDCTAIVLEYMDAWSDVTPSAITPETDSVDSFSLSDAINESVTREVDPATDITATSMPYEIYLTFTYTKDAYFEALELWMSDDNDRNNANLLADIVGNEFSLTNTSIGETKYFWTRVRDSYGNVSDWYPESATAGVSGSTSSVPTAYLDLLAGSITEDELYDDLNTRIDKIDVEFTWVNDIFEDDTWTGIEGLFPDAINYSKSIRDDLESSYATITYVDSVETDIYGASVSSFTMIDSRFDSVFNMIYDRATITYVDSVQADIYGSSVSSFTQINSEFGSVQNDIDSKASITYVDATFTTDSEAQAIASAQIAAEVDGNYAGITEFNLVVADVETAQAQRTIKVNANDHVVGMQMIAGGTGADTSTFIIHADKFQIVSSTSSTTLETPFTVGNINGVSSVGIDGNVIIDGTILADAIDVDDLFAETITVKTGGSIQSNNYLSGSAGWKVDYLGNAELNDVTIRGTLAGVDVDSANGIVVKYADGIWIDEGGGIGFESSGAKAYTIDAVYGETGDALVIRNHTGASSFLHLGYTGTAEFERIENHVDDEFKVRVNSSATIYTMDESRFEATNTPNIGSGSYPFGSMYCGAIDADSITFGAGVLDSYMESTYTPSLTAGSGTITLESSYNTLAYTKIGRQMTVTGEIRISSVSSASGTLQISLPANIGSLSETSEYFTGTVAYNGLDSSHTNSESMIMRGVSSNAASLGFQGSEDWNMSTVADYITSSTVLLFSFTYFTS